MQQLAVSLLGLSNWACHVRPCSSARLCCMLMAESVSSMSVHAKSPDRGTHQTVQSEASSNQCTANLAVESLLLKEV